MAKAWAAGAHMTTGGAAAARWVDWRGNQPLHAFALEPRMMFDGAAVETAAHVAEAAHAAPDAAAEALVPDVPTPVQVRAADPSQDGGKKEVAFVDTSVADWQQLVAGVRSGVEIDLIDGGQSGLAQMAKWAESHSGYDAIHVLSHGAEAVLYLGSDRVNEATLATPVAQAELAGIGASMKAGGDLLIYGCDVGRGADGAHFAQQLALATGADVASSTDISGISGNWTLERTAGPIEAVSVLIPEAQVAYGFDLSTLTVTNAYNDGVGSLRQAITDAASGDTIHFSESLSGQIIRLPGGSLSIAKNLTIEGDINGDGHPDITVSGDRNGNNYTDSGDITVFVIQSNSIVYIDGLIITNGYGVGADGANGLSGRNAPEIVGQSSDYYYSSVLNGAIGRGEGQNGGNGGSAGGGIYNAGTLYLSNSFITGNTAQGGHGGGGGYGIQNFYWSGYNSTFLSFGGGGAGGKGGDASGGVYNAGGKVVLTGVSFSNNIGISGEGGGGASAASGGVGGRGGAPGQPGEDNHAADGWGYISGGAVGSRGHDGTYYGSGGGGGYSGTAYQDYNVVGVEHAPAGADISRSVNEDTAIAFTTANFTAAFSDVDGDSLAMVMITSLPAHGTLALSGTAVTLNQEIAAANLGNLTFTPSADWNGASSFTYNVSDGTAYAATGATVNITVSAVNDVPTVSDISRSGNEDTVIVFTAANFTAAFSDVDVDSLAKVMITSLPAHGTLALSGAAVTLNQEITAANLANLTFTPAADWNGATSFTYNANDGTVYAVSGATVNIIVNAVNDAPTVANVSRSGNEDTAIAFTAANFTAAFSDVDGDSLAKVMITSLPAHGTLALSGTAVALNQEIAAANLGNLTFTPTADWNGASSFTYNVSDGTAYAASGATVNITVDAINDAPTAAGSVPDRTAVVGSAFSYQVASSVFADVDAGDTLTYSATLANGSALPAWLTFNPATRTFSGMPTDVGTISVKVTATDTSGLSASDTFDVIVNPTSTLLQDDFNRQSSLNIGRDWVQGRQALTDSGFYGQTYTEVNGNGLAIHYVTHAQRPASAPWGYGNPDTYVYTPLAASVPVYSGTTIDFTYTPNQDARTFFEAGLMSAAQGADGFESPFSDNRYVPAPIEGIAVALGRSSHSYSNSTISVVQHYDDVTTQLATLSLPFQLNYGTVYSVHMSMTGSNIVASVSNGSTSSQITASVTQLTAPYDQFYIRTEQEGISYDSGNGEYVSKFDNIAVRISDHAPTAAGSVPDRTAVVGSAFSYQVASSVFADVDAGDTLTYSATLANGSALPAWLTFNPATRTFSGMPTDTGTISAKVTATDTSGLSVGDSFAINVDAAQSVPTPPSIPPRPDSGNGKGNGSGNGNAYGIVNGNGNAYGISNSVFAGTAGAVLSGNSVPTGVIGTVLSGSSMSTGVIGTILKGDGGTLSSSSGGLGYSSSGSAVATSFFGSSSGFSSAFSTPAAVVQSAQFGSPMNPAGGGLPGGMGGGMGGFAGGTVGGAGAGGSPFGSPSEGGGISTTGPGSTGEMPAEGAGVAAQVKVGGEGAAAAKTGEDGAAQGNPAPNNAPQTGDGGNADGANDGTAKDKVKAVPGKGAGLEGANDRTVAGKISGPRSFSDQVRAMASRPQLAEAALLAAAMDRNGQGFGTVARA
ncbi:MAG: tandem-95 repeat protein [Alphaproteobacteria bacterium]|nr:tandem-95 repeat protein [Alphaproteobacteria bacterium]